MILVRIMMMTDDSGMNDGVGGDNDDKIGGDDYAGYDDQPLIK